MHVLPYLTSKCALISVLTICAMGWICACPAAHAADKTSGKATIYSDAYNGKRTANGSTYKSSGLSVASNHLPLGSKVLVKNRDTGKSAVVKVTDRMSKHVPAVVDLSKGAAKKIGVHGTGHVDATVIDRGKGR